MSDPLTRLGATGGPQGVTAAGATSRTGTLLQVQQSGGSQPLAQVAEQPSVTPMILSLKGLAHADEAVVRRTIGGITQDLRNHLAGSESVSGDTIQSLVNEGIALQRTYDRDVKFGNQGQAKIWGLRVLSWIGSIVTLGALPGLAKLLAPKSEFAESLKRYLLGDQADTKKLGEFENLFGNFSTLHDSVSEESELARDLETARSTLDKKRAEQKAVEGNIRSLRNVLGPAREAMTEILTDRLYWNGSDPTGYNLTFFNELCGICRDVFGEQSIDGAGGICDIFDRVSRQLQELAQNPAAVNGSRLKQVQRTVFRLKEQCESLKSQMIDRAKTMTEDSSFEEMAARDETHLREMLAKRESESTPSGLDVIAAKVRETAAEAGEAVARAGEAVAEFGTKAKAAVLGFLRKSSSSSEGGETAPAQTSESPKTVKKKLDDTEIKKMQNREKSNKAEIEARKERQESFETKMKNMVTGIGEDLKYLQSINMSTGSEGTASIEQLEERVNSLQSSLEAKRGKITGLSASILESIQQLESQE